MAHINNAADPTEPTPMTALPRRFKLDPHNASVMKPAKGIAGTSHKKSGILSSHPARGVRIEGFETFIEPEDK